MSKDKKKIYIIATLTFLVLLTTILLVLNKRSSQNNIPPESEEVTETTEESSVFSGFLEEPGPESGVSIKADTSPNLPLTLIEAMNEYKDEGTVSSENVDFSYFGEISEIQDIDIENNSLDVVTVVSRDPKIPAGTRRTLFFDCDIELSHFLYEDGATSLLMKCLGSVESEDILDSDVKLIDCIFPKIYIAYECEGISCSTGGTCIFYE